MKLNQEKYTGFEIAVIGMSGTFPVADSIEKFWDKLRKGEEMITSFSTEEIQQKDINHELFNSKSHINAIGYNDSKEHFDSNFFKYPTEEAEVMDPQIRVFHEQVWLALEDAGVDLDDDKNLIGLYAGASNNIIWKMYTSFVQKSKNVNEFILRTVNDKDFLTTLISHKLGLKGPSVNINTACSTSLVSVHMACRSLLMGECNIALAGGVTMISDSTPGYQFKEGMIYSPDGHCRPFDRNSGGTVPGEGAGVVVLKRLDRALKDKDNIHAIIKGSAINNDGNRKLGYTAPSIEGQIDCIKLEQKIGKVAPESISYIEAHGTATQLGDPIELEALNKVFEGIPNYKCAIGSVKSNIGHLDSAAGISGLIKVILALKNRELPSSINYQAPNEKIRFDQGPFFVNEKLVKWNNENESPLRAGVSSFGIGGTNAHIIVEEAPITERNKHENGLIILPVSAKNYASINAYYIKLVEFLNANENLNISDLAYTLQKFRTQFNYKEFILGKNKNELLEELQLRIKSNRQIKGKFNARKIAFMFSGQGTQYYKMGGDLYDTFEYFRNEMDKGFSILNEITTNDYKKVWNNELGEDYNIENTKYTQPLLFVFEYALARLMMKWGIIPDLLIGHSIGEYVAACISGVWTYEDALKIVVKRAEMISNLPEGSMLAVGLNEVEIQKYLSEEIDLAVINSPNQCIVSGKTGAINLLEEELIKGNNGVNKLKVSHAFHSSMMDGALVDFNLFLKQFSFSTPQVPFISNLTGKLITDQEACSEEYWCNHLRKTVCFSDGIEALIEQNVNVLIEVGPGNFLTTLAKQHFLNEEVISENLTRHIRENTNDVNHIFEKIGSLWKNGLRIEWDNIQDNSMRRKIAIPGYCFQRKKYASTVNLNKEIKSLLGGSFDKDIGSEKLNNIRLEDIQKEVGIPFSKKNEDVIPESELYTELIDLFKEFFGREDIDMNTNFFELGGDSLRASSLISLLRKRFDIDVTYSDFIRKTTLEELSMELAEDVKNAHWIKNKVAQSNKIKI